MHLEISGVYEYRGCLNTASPFVIKKKKKKRQKDWAMSRFIKSISALKGLADLTIIISEFIQKKLLAMLENTE